MHPSSLACVMCLAKYDVRLKWSYELQADWWMKSSQCRLIASLVCCHCTVKIYPAHCYTQESGTYAFCPRSSTLPQLEVHAIHSDWWMIWSWCRLITFSVCCNLAVKFTQPTITHRYDIFVSETPHFVTIESAFVQIEGDSALGDDNYIHDVYWRLTWLT